MKYEKLQAEVIKGLTKEFWGDNVRGWRLIYKELEDKVELSMDGYIMFRIPKKCWFINVPEHHQPINQSIIENGLKEDLIPVEYSHSIKIDTVKNPVDIYKTEDGTEICVNPALYSGYLDKWDNLKVRATAKNPARNPLFFMNNNNEVAFMVLPINRKG